MGERIKVGEVAANLQYGGEYRDKLEQAKREGICPFCKQAKDPAVVVYSLAGWFVKKNPYPPKSLWPPKSQEALEIPAQHAFLIVPERHICWARDLAMEDWSTIGAMLRWVIKEYNLPGGVLAMRFDDPTCSGRTIMHLHFHVIVPPFNPNPDPVKQGVQIVPVPFWVG